MDRKGVASAFDGSPGISADELWAMVVGAEKELIAARAAMATEGSAEKWQRLAHAEKRYARLLEVWQQRIRR